jgi:hypothetical protein
MLEDRQADAGQGNISGAAAFAQSSALVAPSYDVGNRQRTSPESADKFLRVHRSISKHEYRKPSALLAGVARGFIRFVTLPHAVDSIPFAPTARGERVLQGKSASSPAIARWKLRVVTSGELVGYELARRCDEAARDG